MPSTSSPNQRDRKIIQHRTSLRWHLSLYLTALILWILATLLVFTDWSAFWPMISWSLVIMVHYLVVRSITIDPEWIEKRTEQVTDDAKDTSHIENIRDHYVHGIRPNTRLPSSTTNETE